MTRAPLNLEDPLLIRMVVQRLCQESALLGLGFKEQQGEFPLLTEDGKHLALAMAHRDLLQWGLQPGENVDLRLKDRSVRFEGAASHLGPGSLEGIETCLLSLPRILRRLDGHRMVDLVPDQAAKCTFTNSRNALLDGFVQGLSEDGLEIVLRDPRQGLQNLMRMGEESLLDLTLGENLRISAPTTVAYFHEEAVGLRFAKQADSQLLDQYCTWIQEQQALQAKRDQDNFIPGGLDRPPVRAGQALQMPQLKVWVDRDPMLLLLTSRGDFAQRMSEAFCRKFGLASLDYVKGSVLPELGRVGGGPEAGPAWGRIQMVLVHNQLRRVSPLDLARQLVDKEKCPLPVILLGTDEDEDKKRHHAVTAGAVDYVAVEPFRVLAVLRKLDEILKLFEGA